MEARINSYPLYVSGQYLTSEHLNETNDFLWQETRLTRMVADGNGIVNGLSPDFTDNSLLKTVLLSAGNAITIDGYILGTDKALEFNRCKSTKLSWLQGANNLQRLMEKAAYDLVKPNMPGFTEKLIDAIEVFQTSVSDNELPTGFAGINSLNIAPAQAMSSYSLVAWIFKKDIEKNHCQQGDCNIKGIVREYIPRYFLVPTESLPTVASILPELKLTRSNRIKNLSQSGSKMGFHQLNFTAWTGCVTEIQNYFSAVPGKNLAGVLALLNDSILNGSLQNAKANFSTIAASVNATNCPQYYVSFADVVVKAINELVSFYNQFIDELPIYSANRTEEVIVFGNLRQGAFDAKRYYFIDKVEPAHTAALRNKLSALGYRIAALINNFIKHDVLASGLLPGEGRVVAIPTFQGDALLQNTAIPFFFNVVANNEVLRYWDPDKNGLGNIFCYYDSKITDRASMPAKMLVSSWANDNFFRIEGHVGMSITTALAVINKLVADQGIPIQVLDCNIDYTGSTKWRDWHTYFSSYIQTNLANLRKIDAVKNYPYNPLKNLVSYANNTSFRNPEEMKVALNDFQAYNGVMTKTKFLSDGGDTPAQGANAITKVVADSYKSIFKPADVADLIKRFNEAANDLTVNPDAKRLLILKDLVGLEYLGGVPRGGTFVILHSSNIVIGDGCLPYFYRIQQGRVYQ